MKYASNESTDSLSSAASVGASSKRSSGEVQPKSTTKQQRAQRTSSFSRESTPQVEWPERGRPEQRSPVKDAPRPSSDTVDRHMRRLEQFLAEVKKNPQRLVTHVERRRAEKTHLAYIVV
uniref:Uncharacterized protein n=1 Tax=Pyrodinium bahamense TaxID=73915 RepID=A0A7S0B650_9DINO